MDIREFGTALIRTGDLDPVYIGLYHAKLPEPQLARLLVAYWYFYHLGFAAWASEADQDRNVEGDDFQETLRLAAENKESPRHWNLPADRWPRGNERRHFRGSMCVNAIDCSQLVKAPLVTIKHLATLQTDTAVIDAVQKFPSCGPWAAFKAADMLERVWGAPIKFDQNIGLMYQSPREGLDMLGADPEFIAVDRSAKGLYHGLLQYFSAATAPPSFNRQCGPQEVESIICKWASMKGGHYHVGKDIHEVREGLHGWGKTAETILQVMPPEAPHEPVDQGGL